MKNEEYHTVRAVQTHVHKSNRKIVETKTKCLPQKHIHGYTSTWIVLYHFYFILRTLHNYWLTRENLESKTWLVILLIYLLIFSDDGFYKSVLVSFVIRTNHKDSNLLYFHRILKFHKHTYQECYIEGSSCKCSTSIHTKNFISQVHLLSAPQNSFPKCLKDWSILIIFFVVYQISA